MANILIETKKQVLGEQLLDWVYEQPWANEKVKMVVSAYKVYEDKVEYVLDNSRLQ